jgi:hypothetical protein
LPIRVRTNHINYSRGPKIEDIEAKHNNSKFKYNKSKKKRK